MRLTPLIISFLLLCGCATGIYLFYNDMISTYQSGNSTFINETSTNYQSFNSTANSIGSYMEDIQNKTIGVSGNIDLSLVDSVMIFINTLGILFQLPNLMINTIYNVLGMATGLSMPSWVIGLSVGIFWTVFAMVILAILFKRDEV